MGGLDQTQNSSSGSADPSIPRKSGPSLLRQLVFAYSISAGLILITLIAQRTGMPILAQRYQEGIEKIWMLRLSVKQVENDLTAQEDGWRAYVMSGQQEFLATLTNGRERYLTDLKRAQALAEQVGDASVRVSLDEVHWLVERWYQTHSLPTAGTRPSSDTASTLQEGKRQFDQVHKAFSDLEDKTNIATQRTQDRLKQQRRTFLIMACTGYVLGVLIGLIALIRSIRQIRRPLESLITAAHQIEQGKFSIRVSGHPYVETEAVAQAFNRMTSEIAAEREGMESLLQSLRQKNLELEDKHRQVEQANQFKSQFLASVTHELRTPLSSMVLYADMLLKGKVGPVTPAQEDALRTILRRGKEQLRLVNDLLDASRLDTKQMPLRLAPLPLMDMLAEAIADVQPDAESKRLQLDSRFPRDPIVVQADRFRLLQVLNNLLQNAVKFTPSGGRIVVSVVPGSDEIEVAITNTGEGIDPEDLPFIFDRFYRGRRSSVTDSSGAGLGLYIAKELVELHGGRLQATSNGEGETTFSLTLQSHPVTARAPEAGPATANIGGSSQ